MQMINDRVEAKILAFKIITASPTHHTAKTVQAASESSRDKRFEYWEIS